MSTVFNRRSFLSASGRAALGWPLLSLAACTRRDSVPAAADDGEWRTLIEYVEKEIPSLLDRSATTPGAAIALVADAQLLWSRGFGVTDRTTNAPVNADTVFEFGSVSKTVFAYEVMKACEKGLLDLDTPLTKYTSERFLAGDPRLDLMTARHVLSHTGGFQNWRSPEDPLKIQFTPGARWDYSGEGYSYLQSVLTHVAGRVDPNDCKTFYDGLRVCGTYAKFLIEIIDPKPADAFRLSTASRAEMIRPQVKITDTLSWGLGWAIERQPGMSDILTHSGDNPGFKAMTAASVDRRSAFIAVTNGDRGFDDVIRPLVRSSQMREFLPVSL